MDKKQPYIVKKKSKFFRIVIPNLQDYKSASLLQFYQLKLQILQRLLSKEKKRGLQYYRIALERHQNGVPHLDILLTYQVSKQRRLTDWDYLLRHGNVTSYRHLNKAIIQYGTKQDKQSLSNFPEDLSDLLQVQKCKEDPFLYLYQQMKRDPFHFNVQQYVHQHNLAPVIKNWSSLKSKLKDMQIAAANLVLKSRAGLAYITRARIQACFSSDQLRIYDSWAGYQTIIDFLNQIPRYGFSRPFKSPQLLLVGTPNTGKTTLVNVLQRYYSIYHKDVSNWFPRYTDRVYPIISWDEFKLKGGMSHTTLLKFLQGSPIDLQYKGGSVLKRDNPLIIMTSNLTLDQHILSKFKNTRLQEAARVNLSARICELIIPAGYDLFILLKLIDGSINKI